MEFFQLLKVLEYWLTQLSRYCGKFVILILFWSSILSLAHLVANALGYADLFGGLFNITFSIYGEKIAWASTSIALATSVAFGHIRNLEINEEKRLEEQKQKWEEDYKAKHFKTPTDQTETIPHQINQSIPQPSLATNTEEFIEKLNRKSPEK